MAFLGFLAGAALGGLTGYAFGAWSHPSYWHPYYYAPNYAPYNAPYYAPNYGPNYYQPFYFQPYPTFVRRYPWYYGYGYW